MNKKMKIVLLAGIVLAVLVLGSCSLIAGMSIEMRVAQFQTDLNTTERTDIIDNFSSKCEDYNQINTSSYWNDNSTWAVGNKPFAIVISSTDSPNAYGTMKYSGTSTPIHFEMVNEGILGGWKILKIWTGDNDANPQIKVLVH